MLDLMMALHANRACMLGKIVRLRYSSLELECTCADLSEFLHSPSLQPCDEQSDVLVTPTEVVSDFEAGKLKELLQDFEQRLQDVHR